MTPEIEQLHKDKEEVRYWMEKTFSNYAFAIGQLQVQVKLQTQSIQVERQNNMMAMSYANDYLAQLNDAKDKHYQHLIELSKKCKESKSIKDDIEDMLVELEGEAPWPTRS